MMSFNAMITTVVHKNIRCVFVETLLMNLSKNTHIEILRADRLDRQITVRKSDHLVDSIN